VVDDPKAVLTTVVKTVQTQECWGSHVSILGTTMAVRLGIRVPPDHHHAAATSRLIVVVTDPDTVRPTVSETVRAHSLNVW
jgi:hypothetical protein